MPDKNTNTQPEITARESAVDAAKPVPVTTPPANGATAKDSPSSNPANAATTTPPASKPRFKKFVPVVVLALAAVILFGIIGGWNRWVGSSGTQKTDDAILRADIT